MNKFEHGGDVISFAKKINCKKKEVIDLSSNINYIKPNVNINTKKLDLSSYPKYEKLYKNIAKHFKVKTKNIELFNGASSAIFQIFKTLNLKHCTLYAPTYLEYKKACEVFNYETTFINRFEDIYKKPKENSLVIFVNPSTPDAAFYDIKKLLEIWEEAKCTVIIDESFIEFANKKSSLKSIKKYKNLYILRSMTKFYSNAGVRVAALISNKKNIQTIKKYEPLWKISCFDSKYIQKAIKDKNHKEKTLKELNKNKKDLKKVLKSYKFIEKIYKCHTNYFLLRLNCEVEILQKHLEKHKIMIRACSNFDFLDKYHARIAIKDKQSIQKLKEALDVF